MASSFRILLLIASGPEALPVGRAFRTDSTSLAVIDIEFMVKSGIFRSAGRFALLSSSDDCSVK